MNYIIILIIGIIVALVVNSYVYFDNNKTLVRLEVFIILVFCLLSVFLLFKKFGFNNMFIINILLVNLLMAISIVDIRKKLISKKLLVFCFTIGFICLITIDEISLIDGIIAVAIGGLILLSVYLITKGAVGVGDVYVFMFIGLFLGTSSTLSLMCMSALTSGIYGVVLMLININNKNKEIAFTPFILFSLVITLALM